MKPSVGPIRYRRFLGLIFETDQIRYTRQWMYPPESSTWKPDCVYLRIKTHSRQRAFEIKALSFCWFTSYRCKWDMLNLNLKSFFFSITELPVVRRGLSATPGCTQYTHAGRLRRTAQQLRPGCSRRQCHGRPISQRHSAATHPSLFADSKRLPWFHPSK